ncbi:hypothetical protein CBS101457_002626 [Exobasidium rhododendri]|nr:hypothetical protein CBS101457_002626 [Exobasidium rhododendri]
MDGSRETQAGPSAGQAPEYRWGYDPAVDPATLSRMNAEQKRAAFGVYLFPASPTTYDAALPHASSMDTTGPSQGAYPFPGKNWTRRIRDRSPHRRQ